MGIPYVGLTTSDAVQRLRINGRNEITDKHSISALNILIRQVSGNYIVYLLVLSIVLSILVGKYSTAIAIGVVVLILTITGFIQEYKAEQAIASLKTMIVPMSMVLRDGKEVQVRSEELVVGDVIFLRSGERVPADVMLLESKAISVDESILTGESIEVEKKPAVSENILDEENILFMGSFIVIGRCVGKVIETGMRTKFGSIANMISESEKEMPLTDKVNQIARYMVIAGVTIASMTGLLMIFRSWPLSYESFSEILILTVALSVAAFPEGLPVVLTTTLALGASRMARKNAIVNRMSAITTLGETTVVCTDKTGTITEGEMTVRKVFAGGELFEVEGAGYSDNGNIKNEKVNDIKQFTPLKIIFDLAVVCNDAKIERIAHSKEFHILGTPTEAALLILSAKVKLFKEQSGWKRIHEQPFSSDRKMMSVMAEKDGTKVVFVKGAPEVILNKCSREVVNKELSENQNFYRDASWEMSDSHRLDLLEFANQWAREAYRVIALAYKLELTDDLHYTEDNLIFLGFAVMEDPPREEVAEAIEDCRKAHVKVKMITGDNKETAQAIGRQVGLMGKITEGKELDGMDEKMLKDAVRETVIFARVRPEHKLRIVKALKAMGEIVTMTGDGVNDAPALKEAHIGVAMGKNGTDVSRSVADLTLKDDNFATIVHAIREGRTIFANIRKFVSYMLSCNYSQLLLLFSGVLLSPFFGWQVPLVVSLQILFMNLITDDMPALTLGFNPTSTEAMKEPPRLRSGIMSKGLLYLTLACGITMGLMALFVYYIEFNMLNNSFEQARSATLVTMILLAIISAYHFRSFRYPVLNRSLMVNPYLFYASLASIASTLVVLYVPLAAKLFETTPLTLSGWFVAVTMAAVYLVSLDIVKYFRPLIKEEV